MNRKQLIVMWVAIGIIVLAFLFPPWRFHYEERYPLANYLPLVERTIPGPYRLVFLGPPDQPWYSTPKEGITALWRAELDWTRLLLPFPVIIGLALGFILTLRGRKPSPPPPELTK